MEKKRFVNEDYITLPFIIPQNSNPNEAACVNNPPILMKQENPARKRVSQYITPCRELNVKLPVHFTNYKKSFYNLHIPMNAYITVPVSLPTRLPSQDRSFTVMAKQFFVEQFFCLKIKLTLILILSLFVNIFCPCLFDHQPPSPSPTQILLIYSTGG